MIGNTATRVLLATVNQHRPTVRSVAAEVGCAISTAYVALRKLDARGLVVFERGKQGALRAAVRPVEHVCDLGYTEGTQTSDPRTARTAGGLADTARGGADMAESTEAAPVVRGGIR